ncbi:MAG: HYR domain-containing protein [Lewinellaceae bacterium]|nr:HYR domain-containing protein [Lewinellaceae bacterium]
MQKIDIRHFMVFLFSILLGCFGTLSPNLLFGQVTVTFNYTGNMQSWTVPAGVTSVTVEAWGAQGQTNAGGNVAGGLGGYATGALAVTPGQILYIFVGGGGAQSTTGGYNGGGNAGYSDCATARAGGGGGASDVRAGGTGLSNRAIVGAGGGGAGGNRVFGCGRGTGGGGGAGWYGGGGGAGWPYESNTLPTGGTQIGGGIGGTSTYWYSNNGNAGVFGQGGNGGNEIQSAQAGDGTAQPGGAGGGLTGGNGLYDVNWTGQSGAGGSSYIGGVANGSTTPGQRSGNGLVKITYVDLCTNDTQAPGISCPGNISPAVLDPNTCTNALPNYTSFASVNDLCDANPALSQSPAPGTIITGVQNVIVTITATDASSNSSSCTYIVQHVDNTPPNASCQNVTVQLNAGGNASITAAQVNNGSSDACGISGLSVSPSSFSCANVGANPVTLTVTDVNGNSSTCGASVTVEDKLPPSLTCVSAYTVELDASGSFVIYDASYVFQNIFSSVSDNCQVNYGVVFLSKTNYSCDDLGENLVLFAVNDVAGNQASCVTTINVTDPLTTCNQPPVADCKNITVDADANCQGTAAGSYDPDEDFNDESR